MNFIASWFGWAEDNRQQSTDEKPKNCSSTQRTSRDIGFSDVHGRKLVILLNMVNQLQDVMVDLGLMENDEDSTSIVPANRCCGECSGARPRSRPCDDGVPWRTCEAPRAVSGNGSTFCNQMIGNVPAQYPKADKPPTPCRRLVADAVKTDRLTDVRPKAPVPRCTAAIDRFKCEGSRPNDHLNSTRSEPCVNKGYINGGRAKNVVRRDNSTDPSHVNAGRGPTVCNGGKSTAKTIDAQSPSEVDMCSIAKYASCGYLECSG